MLSHASTAHSHAPPSHELGGRFANAILVPVLTVGLHESGNSGLLVTEASGVLKCPGDLFDGILSHRSVFLLSRGFRFVCTNRYISIAEARFQNAKGDGRKTLETICDNRLFVFLSSSSTEGRITVLLCTRPQGHRKQPCFPHATTT